MGNSVSFEPVAPEAAAFFYCKNRSRAIKSYPKQTKQTVLPITIRKGGDEHQAYYIDFDSILYVRPVRGVSAGR